MVLLVLAGISLTANAVSWWTGRRTAEVEEQIQKLEVQLAEIRVADAKTRKRLLQPYVAELRELVEAERRSRASIVTELTASRAKALAITKQRFGSRESDSFRRVVLDLELALARIESERAHLGEVLKVLPAAADGKADVPSPRGAAAAERLSG